MKMMLFAVLLVGAILHQSEGSGWPSDSSEACLQSTKQKAMYGKMHWSPSLNQKPFTYFEVVTEWNDLRFNPVSNPRRNGGVYISYTTGIKDGPGGYFGIQLKANEGQFLFSFWDEGRFTGTGHDKRPKAAEKLVWPASKGCKRNCQDCGIVELRQWAKAGLTTGTQCLLKYPDMKVGDKYKITLKKRTKDTSIMTTSFGGGMPEAHKDMLNEQDKRIHGAVWDVIAYDLQRGNKRIHVGSMMMEGNGAGMHRLGTFDEMLGCTKCNAVHHKDTRYGPKLKAADGTSHRLFKMEGLTKKSESTCQKYAITGSKEDQSITFEGGPFTVGDFPHNGNRYQPVWS